MTFPNRLVWHSRPPIPRQFQEVDENSLGKLKHALL